MAGSAFSNYVTVKSRLAAGREVGRLYILWGDQYLCARLVSAMRARLFPAGSFEDLDLLRLDGLVHGPLEVLAAARMAPFVAKRRMIIVERVRALRPKPRAAAGGAASAAGEAAMAGGGGTARDPAPGAGSIGAGSIGAGSGPADGPAEPDGFDDGGGRVDAAADWERFLTGVPASACVVLRLDAPPDARLRLTKMASEHGLLVDCSTQGRDGVSLAGRVLREAAVEMGCKIDWRVQSLLLTTVGTDCGQLVGELEKLWLYRGKEAITEDDVLLLCPRTAEADIWQLLDAVVDDRPGDAARLVRASLGRGENPVALVASLASQIRMMARASERVSAGVSPKMLAAALGANRYWVEQSLRRAGAFSIPSLYRALVELARLDLAIKTGTVDGPVGVESFVLALCAARRAETQKARGPNSPRHGSGP